MDFGKEGVQVNLLSGDGVALSWERDRDSPLVPGACHNLQLVASFFLPILYAHIESHIAIVGGTTNFLPLGTKWIAP